jgi:hypothetical protein
MCAVSYGRIMASLPFVHPPGLIALRFLSAHWSLAFFFTAPPLENSLRGAVEKKEKLKK